MNPAISTTCIAMSRSQMYGVWFHSGSGLVPGASGEIWFRLEVDAVAAKPHRDGENQENCSRPAFPFSGNTPPLSTTWTKTTTTSSGMVLSDELTSAEISRPTVIDATASTAMARAISTSGSDVRNAPCVGGGRAATESYTRFLACKALIRPRTTSFDHR